MIAFPPIPARKPPTPSNFTGNNPMIPPISFSAPSNSSLMRGGDSINPFSQADSKTGANFMNLNVGSSPNIVTVVIGLVIVGGAVWYLRTRR